MYSSKQAATHRKKGSLLIGAGTGFAVGVLLSVLLWYNWFSPWRQSPTDFLYATGNSPTTGQITIVAIDDRSLEELGSWRDWPRQYYAQLIERLHQSGARVIGLDLLFSEPAPDDPILAETMAKAGNVVSPLIGINNGRPVFERGERISYQHFLRPQPVLVKASSALGHINACSGLDGVARCFPATIFNDENGETVPALALTTVAQYLRLPTVNYLPQDGYVTLADRHIPIDEFGRTLINYAGPPSDTGVRSTFKVISWIDLINDRFDRSDIQDKIVLVGVMATGTADRFFTPVGKEKMAGVEIWANAIEMILSKRFLRELPLIWQTALLMSLSIAGGMVFFVLRPLRASIILFPLLFAYWLAIATAFDRGMMLNLLYPAVAVILLYIAAIIYHYVLESLQRRQIMGVLGQYVSPDVAAIVLKSLETGEENPIGISREATVLFADIRNFSDLAEGLSPVETMALLNTYMETMVSIVDQHYGTTFSFTGDGILAVWNMPLTQPHHALRAVSAATAMQKAIQNMEEDNTHRPVKIGIGINTGHIVAGNVGSKVRLKYTVTGDAVNLANSMCELAQGGEVLIGQRTRHLMAEYLKVESRERAFLRHKDRPVVAFAMSQTSEA
jgi:adenylate cyclase